VHAKLSSELASLGHALAVDAERLRTHQADLLAGEPAIRDEMARLEAVRDVCRTAAGRMRGAVETAERNVADLRAKSTPEVDELVCSTTIVHNQSVSFYFFFFRVVEHSCRLINLVAEDNAIEDTIFHLSKALNSGRIDLERFLRVRHSSYFFNIKNIEICAVLPTARRRAIYETRLDREDRDRYPNGPARVLTLPR
jgi:ESCRT-I complex subunit TSG101